MKKIWTLAVVAALGISTIGCGETATTPAKPADKPAAAVEGDKPADAPADKPADAPADKPADAPADKPADAPADKTADAAADNPADAPAEAPKECCSRVSLAYESRGRGL